MKEKLIVTGGLLLAFSGLAAQHFIPEVRRPNVLFIAVDDLKPAIGSFGDPFTITPAMDELADQGVIFTSNYCQQAICAPSRISLFTGMRPDRTGVTDLKTYMRDVNPDIITLPQIFKENGYQTVGFGKLMHGARKNDPESWTIPYRENFKLEYAQGYTYPANGKYQAEESQEVFREAIEKELNWKGTNDLLNARGVHPAMEFLDVPDDAYTDGAIARAGLEMLEQFALSDEPFFLAVGFQKPHLPFAAPKKYHDLYEHTSFALHPFREKAKDSPDLAYSDWGELRAYSGIPEEGPLTDEMQIELIRGYYACVSYVDAQLQKLIGKLKELGLYENTVIVLWGDHGWHLGDHGLWCKHTNFEQATRSPLILSAPGYRKGDVTDAPTEFVDVFPTLCELCGIPVHADVQGASLVPLLKNPGNQVKDFAVSQYPRGNDVMGYSLRTSGKRYTAWFSGRRSEKGGFEPLELLAEELYDYESDPYETINHAYLPKYSQTKEMLSDQLKTFLGFTDK